MTNPDESLGLVDYSLGKPNDSLGKSVGRSGSGWERVICNEWMEFRLICLAFAFGGMEGTSSETEVGKFFTLKVDLRTVSWQFLFYTRAVPLPLLREVLSAGQWWLWSESVSGAASCAASETELDTKRYRRSAMVQNTYAPCRRVSASWRTWIKFAAIVAITPTSKRRTQSRCPKHRCRSSAMVQ